MSPEGGATLAKLPKKGESKELQIGSLNIFIALFFDLTRHSGDPSNPKIAPWRTLYSRFNRSEFITTTSELADMPIAAIQGATIPATANGIAVML